MINQYDVPFSEFMHKPRPLDEVMTFRQRMNELLIQDAVESAGGLRPFVLRRVALFMRGGQWLKNPA